MLIQEILSKLLISDNPRQISKILKNISASDEFFRILLFYVDIYIWMRNLDGAKKVFNIADNFVKLYPDDKLRFLLYIKKAAAFEFFGDFSKAYRIYANMYDDARTSGNELYLAESLMKNATFLEKMSHHKKLPLSLKKAFPKTVNLNKYLLNRAISYLSEAEYLYSVSGQQYNHVASVFNLAYMYYALGKLDDSCEHCLNALDLAENINSLPILANVNLQLANIYEERKNALMSKIHYEKALSLFNRAGNLAKASDIMHKIAWMLASENRHEMAMKFYRQALDLKVSLDYKQALGEFFFDRALIMKSILDFKASSKYFDRALFVSDLLGENGKSLFIKLQIYNLQKSRSSLFSLYEFLSSYKPPVSKEILKAQIHPSYAVRSGDAQSLKLFGFPDSHFNIDRSNLKRLLGDLSRLCFLTGDKERYLNFSGQYKAVQASLVTSI